MSLFLGVGKKKKSFTYDLVNVSKNIVKLSEIQVSRLSNVFLDSRDFGKIYMNNNFFKLKNIYNNTLSPQYDLFGNAGLFFFSDYFLEGLK